MDIHISKDILGLLVSVLMFGAFCIVPRLITISALKIYFRVIGLRRAWKIYQEFHKNAEIEIATIHYLLQGYNDYRAREAKEPSVKAADVINKYVYDIMKQNKKLLMNQKAIHLLTKKLKRFDEALPGIFSSEILDTIIDRTQQSIRKALETAHNENIGAYIKLKYEE